MSINVLISNKVDVFPVRRGKANKPHIELAHPRIVVMQLRDDNFVDELKVDRGGEALLGTKENAVSAFFQSIFQLPTSGQSGGRAGHDKQLPLRESSADFIKLEKHIQDDDERDASMHRQRILRFNIELMRGENFTLECFNDMLLDIDEYERFCETHPGYKNNRAVMAIANIKRVYQDHEENGGFLV